MERRDPRERSGEPVEQWRQFRRRPKMGMEKYKDPRWWMKGRRMKKEEKEEGRMCEREHADGRGGDTNGLKAGLSRDRVSTGVCYGPMRRERGIREVQRYFCSLPPYFYSVDHRRQASYPTPPVPKYSHRFSEYSLPRPTKPIPIPTRTANPTEQQRSSSSPVPLRSV